MSAGLRDKMAAQTKTKNAPFWINVIYPKKKLN
jgi:hypothetical protein